MSDVCRDRDLIIRQDVVHQQGGACSRSELASQVVYSAAQLPILCALNADNLHDLLSPRLTSWMNYA